LAWRRCASGSSRCGRSGRLSCVERTRAPARRSGTSSGSCLAGWWLIIGHLVTGVLLCLTIIGIPLGLANFKLIPVTLRPFGRDIVSIEQAERQGLEQEVTMPASAQAELSGGSG
jgi:hypothetical protein